MSFDPVSELAPELWSHIIGFLDPHDLINLGQVKFSLMLTFANNLSESL